MLRTSFFSFYVGIISLVVVKDVIAQGTIATDSPISYTLTQAMIKNTPIELSYLPPKRLPISRIPSWIKKTAGQQFEQYDVLVSIRSVVKGLALYPSLRLSNIRLVEIDIANAIMPNGEKVVLTSNTEYFWLNSNNLLVMLGILKRDLSALWPEHLAQFNVNYQHSAASIRQVNLALDEALMANDVAFIVPKSEKLSPFVASLSSDLGSEQEALELGLRYLALDSGKKPMHNTWQLDDFSRFNKVELTERLQGQAISLKKLLDSTQ